MPMSKIKEMSASMKMQKEKQDLVTTGDSHYQVKEIEEDDDKFFEVLLNSLINDKKQEFMDPIS